jgi:3-hydroxyisobutyrate dehydrogenase-like beta-hydroxyacid dehydrogenase
MDKFQGDTMQVGFLGFGEVAATFSSGLKENGLDIYTCLSGRSPRTVENAVNSGVKLCSTYRELAEKSDILLSSVVPSMAVEVAKKVGKHSRGVYVDINNISPSTVKTALGEIKNGKTVDAAIIGSVKRNGLNVKIIASGNSAEEILRLNQYGMNITVVGHEPGDASTIKLLRSAYTKGVSALLYESLYHSYRLGISTEVLKCISETETEDFVESANSRMISASFHAKRRAEEMDEVVEFLSEYQNPVMAQATSKFFKNLSRTIKTQSKRPESYMEIFKLLNEE